MVKNVQIDFAKIVDSIAKEANTLANDIMENAVSNPYYANLLQYLNGVDVIVSDEQTYIKRVNKDPDAIHVVVKFGSASTNFGSSVCPVSLRILGSENRIKPAQAFFAAFCAKWNLQPLEDYANATQIWMTPAVSSNFTEVDTGFRNILTVSGTLVIGQSTVRLGTLRYLFNRDQYIASSGQYGYEDVPVISFQLGFDNSLSPQVFGNTEGFTKSESILATQSFTIATYMLDSQFLADCMAVQGFRKRKSGNYSSTKKQNDVWYMWLDFNNGFNNHGPFESGFGAADVEFFEKYKIRSVNISEKIGDIPTLSVAFSH